MIKRILLIDENNNTRNKISAFLRFKGFIVFDSPDTKNIEKTILTENIDILICGMTQREKDGFELLEEFKDKLPIIISSPVDKKSIINEAYKKGALHYIISKKYNLERWFVEIKTIIDLLNNKSNQIKN